MERQEGYYWVRVSEFSIRKIAEYDGRYWWVDGLKYNIFWIDLPENRLTPPNI